MPDNLIDGRVIAPYPKQIDTWNWGTETIIWGANSSDKYTLKLLEPKKGKDGMLSLQYHHEKSETWFQLRGTSWALVIMGNKVCTRLMYPGDIQNLPTGTIHRLMAVTDDCQVLEPSTPDAHAADKNLTKDIVRLHCVFGRPTTNPTDIEQKKIVQEAIEVSDKAWEAISQGKIPTQQNLDLLLGTNAFSLNRSSC